jgi:hypothetical protein
MGALLKDGLADGTVGSNITLTLTFTRLDVHNIGQGEPRHKKYKRINLGGGQAYDRSSARLLLWQELLMIVHDLLY